MSDERYLLLETEKDEEDMFFTSNHQEQACIGYLRGDFGGGKEFWTSWWDHQEELKDPEFKDELDDVVNALRKDGPLKDLSSMRRFCQAHPKAQMSPQSGSEYYGLRIDTAQHRYYLRFNPMQGEYNFYIYCYKAALLERPITVLVVEPMKPCEVRKVCGLTDMQKFVGGDIEAVYPFQEPVAVICNSEGKVLDLPYNRPLTGKNGLPYDIICGTFFLAGISGENFASLTDEQIQRYKALYDNVMIITAEKEPPRLEKSEQKKKRGNHRER